MSRITPESHYRRRSLLVLLWNEAPRIYGLLSLAHQWELHHFYQPDRMVDFDEFALHIAALKRTEPSLVNRVGKHFAKLESFYLANGTDLSKLGGGAIPARSHQTPSGRNRDRSSRTESSHAGSSLLGCG